MLEELISALPKGTFPSNRHLWLRTEHDRNPETTLCRFDGDLAQTSKKGSGSSSVRITADWTCCFNDSRKALSPSHTIRHLTEYQKSRWLRRLGNDKVCEEGEDAPSGLLGLPH